VLLAEGNKKYNKSYRNILEALGPTKSPGQWVPGLFCGVKLLGWQFDHPPPTCMPSWCGKRQLHLYLILEDLRLDPFIQSNTKIHEDFISNNYFNSPTCFGGSSNHL
jgi:hypothetical protein